MAENFRSSFDVNNLKTVINNKNGILLNCHFMCSITPPKGMANFISSMSDISILCSSVTIPSIEFKNVEIAENTYGVVAKRPVDTTFAPLRANFLADAKGDVFKFFTLWMQNVSNINSEGGTRSAFTRNNTTPFEFEYPEWYESTVTVYSFNRVGDIVGQFNYLRAFPSSMDTINLNYEASTEITKLPITFQYHTMSSNFMGKNNELSLQQIKDTFQSLINQAPTNYQAKISPINIPRSQGNPNTPSAMEALGNAAIAAIVPGPW